MRRMWKWWPSLVAAAGLMLAGCGGSQQAVQDGADLTVWPQPPDEPRIRYLASLRGENDFSSGFGDVLKALGGEQAGIGLARPFDVCTDDHGCIYVTDLTAGVVVFDTVGRDVRMFGEKSPVSLNSPRGIVHNAGLIYVVVQDLGQVVVLTREGSFVRTIGARFAFPGPVDLACDPSTGRLYVVDNKLHAVCVYSLAGDSLMTFGGRGEGDGQFNYPQSATVDAQGRLYVVDGFNYRVQVFDSTGAYLRQFGKQGNVWGMFSRPKGIALDTFGNIYVLDANHDNFQVFNQNGELLLFVGRFSHENDGFENPVSIHIDAGNRIYVADQLNKRIQIFQLLRGS